MHGVRIRSSRSPPRVSRRGGFEAERLNRDRGVRDVPSWVASSSSTGPSPECTGAQASQEQDVRAGCRIKVFGWNVGGADLSDLPGAVREATKKALAPDAIILLQEVPRGEPGWSTEKVGALELLSFRSTEAWRGTGVAFNPSSWCMIRRVARDRGCWVLLRHLLQGFSLWVSTAHFSPGCTHAQFESELTNFFEGAPRSGVPVLCQVDGNAPILWNHFSGETLAVGRDGKSHELLGQLEAWGSGSRCLAQGNTRLRLLRPRQGGRQGSIIDLMATRGIGRTGLKIHVHSCHVLGTDHELLEGDLSLAKGSPGNRYSTAPRVWKGGIGRVDRLDQEVLVSLALKCTAPAAGKGYRDPPEVKAAVGEARAVRTKEAWCEVRKLRKHARETDRVNRAGQGDWGPSVSAGPRRKQVGSMVLPKPRLEIHTLQFMTILPRCTRATGLHPTRASFKGTFGLSRVKS